MSNDATDQDVSYVFYPSELDKGYRLTHQRHTLFNWSAFIVDEPIGSLITMGEAVDASREHYERSLFRAEFMDLIE